MDKKLRAALVRKYKSGCDEVVKALRKVGTKNYDIRPGPKEWSPRDIAHHLADSEMTSAIRLRRLIAEDRPTIVGYDQDEFSRRLYYSRPIKASLAAFKAARQATGELLDRLTEEEWAREGTHTESGRYTMEDWLKIYAAHAHDHARQIIDAVKKPRGK